MSDDLLNKALELALEPSGPCPDGEALYRFAASTCSAPERRVLEAHVLSCAGCMEVWRESHALIHASSPEIQPMETPAPLSLPRRQRRTGGFWAAAALAAGFVGILLAGGWAALTLSSLRREVSSLKGESVRSIQPAVAALLDLSPESLRVRGSEEQMAVLEPGALPTVLVLNPLAPYEVPLTVALLGADGKACRSTVLKVPPPGPVTLLIPPGLLTPGAYTAEVKATATGALLDRYPFQIR